MKRKRINVKLLIYLTVLTVLILIIGQLLAPLITDLYVENVTGYKNGTFEHALARELNVKDINADNIKYVVEDDVVFALYTDAEGKSNFVVLARNKNGNYTQNKPNSFIIGGLPITEFDTGHSSSVIYYMDNKYITFAPLQGYSSNPDNEFFPELFPQLEVLDLSKVRVYDSLGKELKKISAPQFDLYYNVSKTLPDDYKVFLEYEGKIYTLLDIVEDYVNI